MIRIVATDLPGATFQGRTDVQVGLQVRQAHEGFVAGDAASASWEAQVQLGRDEDGRITARGPAIHGPSGEKFLYLVWAGRMDGQCVMFRRAKLQLDGVPAPVWDAVSAGAGPLVATLGLTDARGEPLCASVRPPKVRWSVGG